MKNEKNFFERNPIKTSCTLLIIFIALVFYAAEKIFNTPHSHIINKGEQRFIRLREHGPLFYAKMVPDNEYMKTADQLIQKQYILRTDGDGFIFPSRLHEQADLTIVFLGGSTTECAFVDEDLRFPYLVGRILEKNTGLKVNSYNAGMSGNDTMHSIDILLNKVLQTKPTIVIMMENINDLVMLLVEKNYWSNNPTRSLIVKDNISISNSLSTLSNILIPNLKYYIQSHAHPDEFKSNRGNKLIIQKDLLIKEFAENLQTFIDICKIRDIIPILMTQENRLKNTPDPLIEMNLSASLADYGMSYSEFKNLFDAFNETVRMVGMRNHIAVIDLAKEIPQTRDYIYDIVHMNNKGSQFAAQQICLAIEPVVRSKLLH